MKNHEKGRSMIEMLGVLSVMGILSMSGISLFSKALYQRKVGTTIEQISELIINMRNAYHSRRSYDFTLPKYDCENNDDEYCDRKEIIPKSMWHGNKIVPALATYDGQIHFNDDICSGVSGKEFCFWLLYKIDDKDATNACVKIVTANYGRNVKVLVRGDKTNENCATADCNTPMSIEKAKESCSGGVTIAFTVK